MNGQVADGVSAGDQDQYGAQGRHAPQSDRSSCRRGSGIVPDPAPPEAPGRTRELSQRTAGPVISPQHPHDLRIHRPSPRDQQDQLRSRGRHDCCDPNTRQPQENGGSHFPDRTAVHVRGQRPGFLLGGGTNLRLRSHLVNPRRHAATPPRVCWAHICHQAGWLQPNFGNNHSAAKPW